MSIQQFWQTWNIPVHRWASRSVTPTSTTTPCISFPCPHPPPYHVSYSHVHIHHHTMYLIPMSTYHTMYLIPMSTYTHQCCTQKMWLGGQTEFPKCREVEGVYYDVLTFQKSNQTLLTASERRMGKWSEISDYRIQGRGGMGVINLKVSWKSGPVVTIRSVTDDDQLIVITL